MTEHLELPGGARALFSTRTAGNLSTVTGLDHDRGAAERARLRESLGLAALASGRQVHGNAVRRLRHLQDAPQELVADGQATDLRAVGVMVLVADCLPVVLGAEGAVAALHAGWRGLAAGVLEEGVRALRALGAAGGEIVAAIGPCAGVCCYEVGPEVQAAFDARHWRGRFLDLRAVATERLARAGVLTVEHVERCTICDCQYFSHRREGERAGRQAGLAWLS